MFYYFSIFPFVVSCIGSLSEKRICNLVKEFCNHPIPNTRSTVKNIFLEPDFSRTCGFRRMLADTLFYQFQQLKVPISWLDFLQNAKNLIFWHIFVIFGWFRIFDQKRALSVSSYYRYLTSCKKSKWSHGRFSRKSGD